MEGSRLEWKVDALKEDVDELKAGLKDAKTTAYSARDKCAGVESDQRVLVERMGNMIDAYKAQRNALYSAAGALFLLAVGLIMKALGVGG